MDGGTETDISGETASTYTLTMADLGKTVKVTASFKDNAGYAEGPLTSDAYPSSGTIALLELSFAENIVNVDEEAGSTVLTVNLAPASTETVTVDYATRDFHAEEGEDYTATSGTLTFAANETSKTITIPILNDDIYEGLETFYVDLSNPSGTALPAIPTKAVLIASDDAVPTASMAPVTVDEGAGTMTLTLRVSHPSGEDITYSTIDDQVTGTATEGDDYDDFLLQGGRRARITVSAGNLSQTFNISIVNDNFEETDETIIITWEKLTAHTVTPERFNFTGTIEDDDAGAGAARGKPRITGTAEVGRTLTANTSGISDQNGNTKAENGDAGFAYTYQWYRVDAGAETQITGARGRGRTYTLVQADADETFRVEVRFTDDAGNSEGPLTSNEYPVSAVNGELQLVDDDGPTVDEGRLEVFHKGEWGTVCDDRLDNANNIAPQKACQFMGYATGEWVQRDEITPTIGVAPSSQPIWLDDVRCFAAPGDNRNGTPPTKLHHCYHAGWGLNNCTHDEDVHLSCSGTAMNQTEASALTATLEDFPTNHDGSGAFTFRIAFSVEVTISPQDMKDHALTVTGGTVTNATQVDGRSDLWELTVEPAGTGAVSILVPLDRACTETGALCTADGQALSTAPGHSVPGPAPVPQGQQALTPLAAGFVSVPPEHDGETEFWLELSFDAAVAQGSKGHIQALLGVTGGSETRMRRKDGRLDHWRIRIQPSSHEAVTVTLSPSPPCGAAGAVCTEDGRTFTAALATRIQGPPGLAVADAEVEEAANASLAFAVTLSRAPSGTVTVDYATSDGTATAGSDYTATSGTLTFAAGETAKTVSVPVLNDAHDEGSETLTLTLSNPSGAYLADGTATGTINNSGLMPQAWLARFGRTVADQVMEAVEGRVTATRTPGTALTVAGQAFGSDAAADPEEMREAEARLERLATWFRGGDDEESAGLFETRAVTGREVLAGTSFALTEGTAESGLAGLWGRGAVTRFDGREGDLTLDGEVESALLGADWARGRWAAGLALGHSQAEGGYRSPQGDGAVESTLTGVYPYGRYDVNDWLSLWGVVGYGTGSLTLTPEGQAPIETDMDLRLAALGGRSVVVKPPADGGLELAATADAMVVQTASDEVRGSAGSIAASEAEVTRIRLGLEGAWRGIGSIVPSFEIGVRQDGGDAETGFGADIGAGLAWSDLAQGIEAEIRARGLLTHEDSSFKERGFAGSFAWDPDPASDLGPSLTLRQTVGAPATGGADALLAPESAQALIAANDEEDDVRNRRLEATLGYGIPAFGGRYTTTPAIGFGLTEAEREYSHSWRLAEAKSAGLVFGLDVEGTRRESVTDGSGPEHLIGFGLGWRLEGARREGFELRLEGSRLDAANDDRAPEDRIGLRMSARW